MKEVSEPFYLGDMADGAVRMLLWAVVLLSRELPSLLVMDVPETGLHPAWMKTLSEWIKMTAEHTQIIVITHNPDLLDGFTDQWQNVVSFNAGGRGRFLPTGLKETLLLPKMPPDLPEDFLMEDMSNLGLVLNDLQHQTTAKKAIVENLKLFNPEFDDITTKTHGGTIQIFLHEKNLNHPIPATRLSDGTLRFLCLLVILCHPDPPPLICIEEPELGLPPDILPHVAQLLLEASKRTQLIVTTHSDILVDEFTDIPEFVIVCEKENGSTSMQRLQSDALNVWLQKYSLGELWRSGEIGGNRW